MISNDIADQICYNIFFTITNHLLLTHQSNMI